MTPVRVTLLTVNDALPVLLSTTVWGALDVPTAWLEKVRDVGARETAGAAPVPVRPTVCGVLLASSLMVTVPVMLPGVVGEKVTVMVQLAPGPRELPQLLVCAKLWETLIEEIVMMKPPELLSVTVWGALVVPESWVPKARLIGSSSAAGGLTPLPVRLISWLLIVALSLMVMVPVLAPGPRPAGAGVGLGLNVTVKVHVVPGGTLTPVQLSVVIAQSFRSTGIGAGTEGVAGGVYMSPVSTIEFTNSDASPEFVMVTVCDALGIPNPWLPKARLRGEIETTAEVKAFILVTKASPAPAYAP